MDTTTPSTRWWDLPAAALLLAAILTAATRLVITGWTDHLEIVQTIAILGAIAGLAIGQSSFPPRAAALMAFVFGAFAIGYQLGNTLQMDILWQERIRILVDRLTIIITQVIRRDVVQDSLLFILLMSVLFWVVSAYAGYSLTRYGLAWNAVLPIGLALFAINSFDALVSRRAWYLAVFLFFALVLIARMTFMHHQSRWQHSRTALPPHLGLDFIRFTLLAASLIVLFAWTAPALASTVPAVVKASQPLRQKWNEVRDRMDNAFASLRSNVGIVSDYYGTSVLLGRGNELTDKMVFTVRSTAPTPASLRYYWRARTYDTYENGQWLSTIASSRTFKPDERSVIIPKDGGRWTGSFEFATGTYVSTVFSPSQPYWFSRPAQLEVAANSDGSLDISAFRATPALNPGAVYQVQASVSNATIYQMRNASNDYPQWVLDRYLQLPDSITERTRQLAADITAGMDNPYDKVNAITNYLRENMTYQETIPARPSNRDAVDWFLFDLKKGFCNYYATAEVVMLRSIGIPARWSVGFAQGEPNDDNGYFVRQRDAHAWPEIYFPGLGWIEFEPTAAQPEISRQLGEETPRNPMAGGLSDEERRLLEELRAEREDKLINGDNQLTSEVNAETPSPWPGVFLWLIPLAVGGATIYLLWRSRTRFRLPVIPVWIESTMLKMGIRPPKAIQSWARLAALPPLSKAYLEINRALRRLGVKPALTDTPRERAAALAQAAPPAEMPAQRLVHEYQVATFSPQPADLPAAVQASQEIRKVSLLAMLQRFLSRFQRPSRGLR